MIIQIHRQTIHKDYTLSQVQYSGGEFTLLEPPLLGLTLNGPHALTPQQKKMFIRIKGQKICVCFPRCGKKYLQYLTPVRGSVRVDEANFEESDQLSPLYVGRQTDERVLCEDLESWQQFYEKLTVTLKSRQHVKVIYS